jgi:hypothetical protein
MPGKRPPDGSGARLVGPGPSGVSLTLSRAAWGLGERLTGRLPVASLVSERFVGASLNRGGSAR